MTLPPASQLAPVQQHALPAQADGQPLAKKRTRKVGRAYSLEEEDSLRRVVEESTRQMASQAESQESRDPFRIYGIHVGNEIRNLPASLWNEAKFQVNSLLYQLHCKEEEFSLRAGRGRDKPNAWLAFPVCRDGRNRLGLRPPVALPSLPSHLDGYVDAVSRHGGGNRPRSFQQRLKMGAGDQSPQPQRSTNQPATPPAKLAPPAQPPASAPARALSQAKKTLRHSPLPKLPKTDFKIVFRPGGGLNLCDVNGGMLLPLSCMAAELHYQEARNQDKLRINPYNNSYTISTPSEDRTKRWANRSRSAACNPTPPPPLEPSSPEASELPESEGSPDSNVGQEALELDLLLLADVAWDVQPLPLTAEMETQTDTANSKGPLQLMLSATDGACGSTQVTHIPQADKM
ncbi:hypothetical protein HPB47_027810 [Ixodes persulcatus]|uniref:Uncharacterized protein n=1 Tax=Ixodes persulcatus TaxID=34615 RepID=A0AC60PV36_IXOPE|nr:hypothetical protein HPB47_027810 [Ixodes persulcatus]